MIKHKKKTKCDSKVFIVEFYGYDHVDENGNDLGHSEIEGYNGTLCAACQEPAEDVK